MVKFAKIAKMTVIIAFSQGAIGAKNRKNLIFSKWFEITQIMFLSVFWPSDGFYRYTGPLNVPIGAGKWATTAKTPEST